jgi:hypothetical protein
MTSNLPTPNIRDLGWLLRNWQHVSSFKVTRHPQRGEMPPDVTLTAKLKTGKHDFYSTPFMDKTILADWLHRPVFDGLPVTWLGKKHVVGAAFSEKYGHSSWGR